MQSRSFDEKRLKSIKQYAKKRKDRVVPLHFNVEAGVRERAIQRAKQLDLSFTAYIRKLIKKDINEKILKEY